MKEYVKSNRRKFLTGLGGSLATGGLAGCLDSGPDAKFRIVSTPLESLAYADKNEAGAYFADLDKITKNNLPDHSEEFKQEKIAKLLDTGTVTTRDWELTYRTDWGPTYRDKIRCFERDGTYYRVRVDSVEEFSEQQWEFQLDWAEQPDDAATVVSPPVDSLSEVDQLMVTTALDTIPAQNAQNAFPGHARFHSEYDHEASDLVPDPPFDYLKHDGGYLEATVEQVENTIKKGTYSIEPVAQSREEYEAYAQETFPDARFSDVSLSTDAREILDEAVDGLDARSYDETPPLSDGFEEVLTELNIAKHLKPHDEYEESTRFEEAVAEFNGQWHEFYVVIYP